MALYCISYNIRGTINENLITAIKSYGLWWHQSESVWFIETQIPSRQVIENLRQYIPGGGKLLVIEVKKTWWGIGLTDEEITWIRNRNF